MAENKAPYVIIPKSRPGSGTFMKSERIPRYWRSKATGQVVEARRCLRDVDRNQMRVVIFDPDLKVEMNLPYCKAEPNPYQPPGAPEILMERPLTELYEPYSNNTTRA